jgi:hypothetical protein
MAITKQRTNLQPLPIILTNESFDKRNKTVACIDPDRMGMPHSSKGCQRILVLVI